MGNKDQIEPQYVQYERTRIKVFVPFPVRKGRCVVCGRSVAKQEIKITQRHHTKYAYELETVRKNPVLALDNSLELCFSDHAIGDALRGLLLSNPRGGLRKIENVVNVIVFLPEEQQIHFTHLARAWLKMYG
jgi:hypothetical protein